MQKSVGGKGDLRVSTLKRRFITFEHILCKKRLNWNLVSSELAMYVEQHVEAPPMCYLLLSNSKIKLHATCWVKESIKHMKRNMWEIEENCRKTVQFQNWASLHTEVEAAHDAYVEVCWCMSCERVLTQRHMKPAPAVWLKVDWCNQGQPLCIQFSW